MRVRGLARALAALATAVLAAHATLAGTGPRDRFVLDFSPVPLNPLDPSQQSVGPLRYRGGLWLRSEDPRFGGLSDLRVSADGAHLLALSDCGLFFDASLRYDREGRLVGLADARLTELPGPGGRPLGRGEVDAEALAPAPEGGWDVAFEDRIRIWRYPSGPPEVGPPVPAAAPPGLAQCPRNKGPEAMVRLADGRLLVACEGPTARPEVTTAWIGRGAEWRRLTYPLVFGPDAPGRPFRPTGAARLPGGDILFLERRYPLLALRLRRVSGEELRAGRLEGAEVARLSLPLSIDNMEGIDVRTGSGGETLVYLVSDDNRCAKRPGERRSSLQRTLLLLFALEGPS
jgi:hypothetical protein